LKYRVLEAYYFCAGGCYRS